MAKNSKAKNFFKTLGIGILATVLVAGVTSAAWALGIHIKERNEQKQEELLPGEEAGANGGTLVNPNKVVAASGVNLNIRKIRSVSEVVGGEEGIDPTALEDTYELTVTIDPADAVATCQWSISWANASSTFASGKTVTDYVTLTATEGSKTAVIQGLQAFGEPINVTVTTKENAEATATCTVDYAKRITDLQVTYAGISPTGTSMPNFATFAANKPTFVGNSAQAKGLDTNSVVITPVYSVYTVDDTFTNSIKYSNNPQIISAIENATSFDVTPVTDASNMNILFNVDMFRVTNSGLMLNNTTAAAINNVLNRAKGNSSISQQPVYLIKVSSTGTYSNYSATYRITVNFNSIAYLPVSAALSDTNVIM